MNANEMTLSIKIGEHAVDVAGPVHEVWKVLEVFQRLSGFDPQKASRDREIDYYNNKQMQVQQMLSAQQMLALKNYMPPTTPYISSPLEPDVKLDPGGVKSQSNIEALLQAMKPKK